MANPQRDVGIDLNEQVPVHDIDLNDLLPVHAHVAVDVVERRNTVEVYLPNPSDWDDIPEDLFQFNNTEFWEANEEGKLYPCTWSCHGDRFAETKTMKEKTQRKKKSAIRTNSTTARLLESPACKCFVFSPSAMEVHLLRECSKALMPNIAD